MVDNTKIPLHPGTHLTDRHALDKLRDKWVNSSPSERVAILSSIFFEMENFAECYYIPIDVEINEESFATDDDSIGG